MHRRVISLRKGNPRLLLLPDFYDQLLFFKTMIIQILSHRQPFPIPGRRRPSCLRPIQLISRLPFKSPIILRLLPQPIVLFDLIVTVLLEPFFKPHPIDNLLRNGVDFGLERQTIFLDFSCLLPSGGSVGRVNVEIGESISGAGLLLAGVYCGVAASTVGLGAEGAFSQLLLLFL